jgi:ATP-dependent 26S proteasome regulatory subunit
MARLTCLHIWQGSHATETSQTEQYRTNSFKKIRDNKMKAELLKRCVRALAEENSRDFTGLCESLIREEKQKGHSLLAGQLERTLLDARARRRAEETAKPVHMSRLVVRETLDQQLVRLKPEQARHTMVLDDVVEDRFMRIEHEYAARERLAKHGLQHTRRVLLYGPPGCGKTLGAERVSWNTGLPLVKVHFDTLISSYFGESATNLRKVFEIAHRSPCILFLDECDYVAKKRGDGRDVGEVSRIANTLLQLLEDYDAPGLLLAATNLDDMLDHAIFRRFDDVFCLPLPGKKQIADLLALTLSAIPTDRHICWGKLADELTGMSAATVVQIAQDAAKHVILDGGDIVHHEDLQKAITRIYRIRQQGGEVGGNKR